MGSYGDSDSDEEAVKEPESKKARADDAAAMPPPTMLPVKKVSKNGSAETDSKLMPPPAVPGSRKPEQTDAALMPPPAVPGFRKPASAAAATPEPEEADEPDIGPAPLAIVPAEEASPIEVVAASSEAAVMRLFADTSKAAEPAEPAEEGSQLPEGFFDNPELDAKARGIEAPAVVAQRELEEGLKRFEREMLIEREKAEEARNELDEEKFEELAVEEEEFQRTLQGRVEALRHRQAEALKSAPAPAVEESHVEAEVEEEGDDSGSDIDFDWRAKDFG